MNPRKGMRFLHAHWLNKENEPLLHVVTKITKGTVYYRGVYIYGDREELGGPTCCPVEEFPRWVKKVVDANA